MKISALLTAVTVADELSFVKASRELYVSQSAVTQQIKKLEEELGFPLFIRDKHHVSLTVQGEIFLPVARKMIALYNSTVEECRARNTDTMHLRTGYIGQIHLHAFQDVIKAFSRQYPDCHLELVRLMPSIVHRLIRFGNYDLFIGPSELFEGEPIPFHMLYMDHHFCVMNYQHPLADWKELSLFQILPYRLLMPDQTFPYSHMDLLIRKLEETGLPFRYGQGRSLDQVTIKLLESQSDLAVIPGFAVPVHPSLKAVPLKDGISIPTGVAGEAPPESIRRAFLDLASSVLGAQSESSV